MKRILTILLAALLLWGLLPAAFAAETEPAFVVDELNQLEDPEVLSGLAANFCQQTDLSVMFVTCTEEDEDLGAAAERYFNENAPTKDGLILIMNENHLYMCTFGTGEDCYGTSLQSLVDAFNGSDTMQNSARAYYDLAFRLYDQAQTAAAVSGDPEGRPSLVVDEADLLTDAEEQELARTAREVSEKQGCDVVLVTVDSMGATSDPQAFADDYFDYKGYGQGENRDGILFLISMADRDWAISTRGYGIYSFTDYGQQYLVDQLKSNLSSGRYADAFRTYYATCDDLLTRAHNGQPLDVHKPTVGEKLKRMANPFLILLALGAGFLIAGIPMAKLKRDVTNVKWNKGAVSYLRTGSMQLTKNTDRFLYANTTSRRIQTNSGRGSGGGFGGGSSTHTSSSGAIHGGSHGKF